jgi:predicted transcriptional regulator YheO
MATVKPKQRNGKLPTKRTPPVCAIDPTTYALVHQMAAALQRLMGPTCEVVIHDFSDFEHSIMHIEGDVTHRTVGGAATDLLLTKVAGDDTREDLHSYFTSLPGGKLMKSSTVFLRDKKGKAVGAFCINLDVTAFTSFRGVLDSFVKSEDRGETVEKMSDNFQDTVQSVVTETLFEVGGSLPLVNRDDKIDLIARLDSKGIFRVQKAVPIVADMLDMSRATIYNYLREARSRD